MNTRHLRSALLLIPALSAFAAGADVQKPELQKPVMVVQAGHASRVRAISFSPDGRLLASASGEGTYWTVAQPNVVKLWDVATGTELRTLDVKSLATWVGFSPDGRQLAAKGTEILEKVQVWDVASGAELADVKPGPEFKSSAASPDGKIAAEIAGNDIRLRDAATGAALRTLASRTSDFQKAMFSPDNGTLACGGTRLSIRVWDLRAGVLRTLVGHTQYPIVADFSPDSRLFASGGRDLTVRVWDVASGREIKCLKGHTGEYVFGMKFSPDGKRLLSYDRAGFKLWDVESGRELAAGPGMFDEGYVIFSPRGDVLAAGNDDGVKLFAAATGKELHALKGSRGWLKFSPDGKLLLSHGLPQIGLWDVASGKSLVDLHPSVPGDDVLTRFQVVFNHAVLSPDARTLAVSETDIRTYPYKWYLYLHDVKTGKRLHRIEGDTKQVDYDGRLDFSADSKRILADGEGHKALAVVWDVASGKPVERCAKEEDHSSPKRPYDYSFGSSGELHLCEWQTGRVIVSLIGIDETDWLVATPEGFFDGSPAAWKRILWRFNNDTFNYVPLESFFNEFYHPGLLQDVLAGKSPAPPDGKGLSRIDRRQPQVTLALVDEANAGKGANAHSQRTVKLAIDVAENGSAPLQPDHPATSGARDVRLFRNGSLVKAWRGDVFALGATEGCKPLSASATDKTKRMRCEVSVPIVAGANEFTAYAFNQGNVKSADATLAVTGAEALRRSATLHVLAVGVNSYEYGPLNLRYAVADAEGFSAEIMRQQASLHNFARAQTTLLMDTQATKSNILAALAELSRKVQPEDTVIVYFAGHGAAQGNQFYLIPHDLGYADNPDVGLAELLQRSISDRELERAFERVDAAQFLFVVDACNSGQALEAEEKRRGPMNSKGLAQLAYEKGIYVLTAAQGFQAAQEVSKLGHGLLTYVLVEEGLKQAAADAEPKDNRILLREWLDYAARRVPQVQIQEMEHAHARGGNLTFADHERDLSVGQRAGQRPRVFYRREAELKQLVVAGSEVASTPKAENGDKPGAVQGQPALSTDPIAAESTAARAAARPLVVAIADRTLMDQPLPKEIKQQWHTKVASLVKGDSSSFKLDEAAADADWLIQVAALERTDIIYLAPSKKLLEQPNDAFLRMSPPGESATAWLEAELKELAHSGNGLQLPSAESLHSPGSTAHADDLADGGGTDSERSFMGVFRKGPAENLKADIVEEQSGIYHTPNRTQAVLGTYGKMVEGNRLLRRLPRFEHRGLVQQLERVRRFITVQRQGRGSGKEFLSFVGNRQAWQVVDLGVQVSGGRQSEVAFEMVGVRLDQNDVVKALNADRDAVSYFDYLSKNKQVPCLVLENMVFTSYSAAQGTNLSVGGNAKTVVTTDAVGARVENQRTSSTQFTAPVIRCYQMYEVKLYQNQVMELVAVNP